MCKRGLVTAGLCCCVSMLGWVQFTEAAADKARFGTERVLKGRTDAAAAAEKVIICHKADDVKYFELSVAAPAVPGHLRHGDCVVDDGVPCTVDSCDASLGCVHAPDNGACDDGDACTSDSCDPAAGCRNTDNLTCRGACCFDLGCVDGASAEECAGAGATYLGNDTTCAAAATTTCPTGACCAGGTCHDETTEGFFVNQLTCQEAGGGYLGDGTTCTATSCTEACCFGTTCEERLPGDCTAQGGDPQGPGTDCGFGPLTPCTVIKP